MRLALFSPLPPARSGIADYSAALLESLRKVAAIDVFDRKPDSFDPAEYDGVLYQVGNNGYHAFVYEQALLHPGIVVMHEANLHHLIAGMTIGRQDWDAYMREVEFDGGPSALEYAQRVRALEVGPDYEGVPMLRRLLAASKGAIAHSRFVEGKLRESGFDRPVAVIPHGAWLPTKDGWRFRDKLAVGPGEPLIGIFGFLKPYKRIPEALRAFRRLVRVHPGAKMILVGEPHPDLPLDNLIWSLGLSAHVRKIGYADIEDFNGFTDACDIVLNLRYPTVGETSGTLLRALGLGKPVLVSDVGAFAEYPDEVCLKVPVDSTEEDCIFEYLNLLVTRPDLKEHLGRRAREWVARECSWDIVAERYVAFVEAVRDGREWQPQSLAAEAPQQTAENAIEPDYILGWAQDEPARGYIETHLLRLRRTLELTPPGAPDRSVLEMGAYLQITPALRTRLGYGYVRGCHYGKLGTVEQRRVVSEIGEEFSCEVDLFDAERDRFPYEDESFDTVVCGELIEHLTSDPMHMMGEINRILKPGGHLVLTTPNVVSLRAIAGILYGYHPAFFASYIRPRRPGEEADARHNREYAPREIHMLFENAGLELERLETGEFRDVPRPEQEWVRRFLEEHQLPVDLRGDGIYAVGRKTGPVRDRYPQWLYE